MAATTDRKSFVQLLKDATFTAVAGAVIAGCCAWAGAQWVDVFSPNYAPNTVITDTHYITFED
jgi:hypothetical protein